MRAMGASLLVVLLLVLGGCTTGGNPAPAPPPTTTAVPAPYRAGDCLTSGTGAPQRAGCELPHEAEVVLAQERPIGAACQAALRTYLGSPDVEASRLEARTHEPAPAETDRWSFCLVVERSPQNASVQRTGSLRGALASGLGSFQRCVAQEPFQAPVEVVPCDQPHRSEAVPGVLDLGSPAEPMPPADDLLKRTIAHCDPTVTAYLGGEKPDVQPSATIPQADDWAAGRTVAVCYAISDTPTTGTRHG